MKACATCNAPLKDVTQPCPFCGTVGPDALAARQAQEAQRQAAERAAQQQSQAESVRAQANARPEIERSGRWALASALAGTVVCCPFPVGGVLGIVFGLRARRLAKDHGLPPPTMGTIGLGAGVAGILLAVGVWSLAGVMMVKENHRKAELRAAAGDGATLDVRGACALAELELIDRRYQGYTVMDDFECEHVADLELRDDEAVLRGARFAKKDGPVDVVACLTHHSRWTVKQVRGDDDCSAPPPPPTPPNRPGARQK